MQLWVLGGDGGSGVTGIEGLRPTYLRRSEVHDGGYDRYDAASCNKMWVAVHLKSVTTVADL